MPCTGGSEPSIQEHVAKLIIWICEKLQKPIDPIWIIVARGSSSKDLTPQLCEIIKDLSEEQKDFIIYNARDPMSRKLADWWEKHQEEDRIREFQEFQQEQRERQEYERLKKKYAE